MWKIEEVLLDYGCLSVESAVLFVPGPWCDLIHLMVECAFTCVRHDCLTPVVAVGAGVGAVISTTLTMSMSSRNSVVTTKTIMIISVRENLFLLTG